MDYADAETLLIGLITANLSGYNSFNTVGGKEDAAFKYANANKGNVCLIDYAGGDEDAQVTPHGKIQLWEWKCVVSFFLAYDETTIEDDIRAIAKNFVHLRRDNKSLSGDTSWRISSARAFSTVKRNDRLWVPVSFMVNIKTPI